MTTSSLQRNSMEYILTEAEEADSLAQEEEIEEEEEEDTGLGTYYSDLFSADTDSDANRSEGESHPALLNQQRLEDADNLLPELSNLLAGQSSRRGEYPGDDQCDNNVSHRVSELSDLLSSNRAVSKKSRARPASELHSPSTSSSSQETPGPKLQGPPRCKIRRISRPGVENRISSENSTTIQYCNDNDANRKPLRPLQLFRSNTGRGGRTETSGPCNASGSRNEKKTATPQERTTVGEQLLQRILTAKNTRAAQLAIFRELYSASYCDLTRVFKSDKTQSHEWVCIIIGCAVITLEAVRECLKAHTEFLLCDINPEKRFGLFYCGFLNSKNRDGVRRCFKNCNVDNSNLVMCDPPNKRSVTAALFFQKLYLAHGEIPAWCADVISNGQLSGEGFSLSTMVQWALDNNYCDEGQIAYNYALLAETELNAQLWLNSNSQAKYVRDAAVMVRHFRRGQLHATPMLEHIAVRMRECVDNADQEGWKRIVLLLRYQHCGLPQFLLTLKSWLRGRPKKSTIAIIGVSDSGKTMMSLSLIKFLEGRVLNYATSKSQFWLQPLADCKAALLDDVTFPCWDYLNTYLRNMLDGNPICIDCKYRAPLQITCPPIILTSNYDPHGVGGEGNETYKYLFSRISFLYFNRPIPYIGGQPRFLIEPTDWRSFFIKFREELSLELEQYDYGQSAENTRGPSAAGD
ncbi:E1 [Pygoscelis adeliae papillomavirus 2]|uniref:DNA 3'-5' helicase n=1 Tax=Pygoscelis adeliae papillomavirus 2 TaxID=2045113 RepID=A0A291PWK7_9PAPI|nr:E1 [Pygoscelis adeliae papillomavirus 2]